MQIFHAFKFFKSSYYFFDCDKFDVLFFDKIMDTQLRAL